MYIHIYIFTYIYIYIYSEVISCEFIKILKLSYNFIASLISLIKIFFYKRKRPEKTACNFNKT